MDDTSNVQQPSGQGKQEYLSRRERRQMMRRGATGGGSSWIRRTLIWGGAVAVIALVIWGMVKLSAQTPLPTDGGTLTDAVTEKDFTLGPASASVTLVEYSDFQCPACRAFAPVVKQALADPLLKDKVRFVYRSFPLTNIHPNAEMAARAAQAAGLQGKFWDMHDALFEGQTSWSGLSGTAARQIINGYASRIGLDAAKFDAAMESSEVKDAVRDQVASGERAGVNSTPSFFINGTKMAHPQSYEQFRQFLVDAANANP